MLGGSAVVVPHDARVVDRDEAELRQERISFQFFALPVKVSRISSCVSEPIPEL
jgi:hypothetical protein